MVELADGDLIVSLVLDDALDVLIGRRRLGRQMVLEEPIVSFAAVDGKERVEIGVAWIVENDEIVAAQCVDVNARWGVDSQGNERQTRRQPRIGRLAIEKAVEQVVLALK